MNQEPNTTINETKLELKSAKTLLRIANISGPVSILIGGILLGACGLTCAIVARAKLTKLHDTPEPMKSETQALLNSSKVSIVICIVAICLNAVALYFFMPQLIEMMQEFYVNGASSVTDSGATGAQSLGPSTWG